MRARVRNLPVLGESAVVIAGKCEISHLGGRAKLAPVFCLRLTSPAGKMTRSLASVGELPFQAHIELLHFFLAQRDEIVERIQGMLNAQRKPLQYLQDSGLGRVPGCTTARPIRRRC